MSARVDETIRYTFWLLQVLCLVFSVLLASLVVVRWVRAEGRARRKRMRACVLAAAGAISPSATDMVPSTPRSLVLISPRLPLNSTGGHHSDSSSVGANVSRTSFLRTAGVLLSVLDLLAFGTRLIYQLSFNRAPEVATTSVHDYLVGLVVETAWLQALWILKIHFTIIWCVRRRESAVTGHLRTPFAVVVTAWLMVGLGPVALSKMFGIPEASVRDPVSLCGSVLGLALMGYLLSTYRLTLREFRERKQKTAGTREGSGSRSSDQDMTSTLPLGTSANLDKLNSTTTSSNPLATTGGSSASSSGSGGADLVEQRLRQALYRLLVIYVAVFLCVIASGLLASVNDPRYNRALRVIEELFNLPYTLLGVINEVMVGGLRLRRKRHRLTPEAIDEIKRRKARQDGQHLQQPLPVPLSALEGGGQAAGP